MKEIESNKHAWSQISKDHYRAFSKSLREGTHRFNPYIQAELGDISGKDIIHLQCNTGADTILLARMGAHATGVDLVPDNVFYAKKLAQDCGVGNVDFIESDIMELAGKHHKKYDLVFVSEGAIGWLPDLRRWAATIRHLLKEDGFVYVFDLHPFFLMMNLDKLSAGKLEIQYPYFDKTPDVDDSIGGYATETKYGVQAYSWMYTVSDLIDSLAEAGLHAQYFHEFAENIYNPGGMVPTGKHGLFNYPFNGNKFPMSFSIRATVYPR